MIALLFIPLWQLFTDNSHIGRFVNTLAAELEACRPLPHVINPTQSSPTTERHASFGVTPSRVHGAQAQKCNDMPLPQPPQSGAPQKPANVAVPLASETAKDTNDVATTGSARAIAGLREASYHQPASVAGASSSVPQRVAGVGSSVEALCQGLGEAEARGEAGGGGRRGSGALERLWVRDGDGRKVLFADVSVYTRRVLRKPCDKMLRDAPQKVWCDMKKFGCTMLQKVTTLCSVACSESCTACFNWHNLSIHWHTSCIGAPMPMRVVVACCREDA